MVISQSTNSSPATPFPHLQLPPHTFTLLLPGLMDFIWPDLKYYLAKSNSAQIQSLETGASPLGSYAIKVPVCADIQVREILKDWEVVFTNKVQPMF